MIEHSLKNNRRILMLQSLRNQRCKRNLEVAISKKNELERKRNEYIQKIQKIQACLNETSLTNGEEKNCRMFVPARQYWLQYDLEKDNYYFDMGEEDYREAKKDCDRALQKLHIQDKKNQLLHERILRQKNRYERRKEHIYEAELPSKKPSI